MFTLSIEPVFGIRSESRPYGTFRLPNVSFADLADAKRDAERRYRLGSNIRTIAVMGADGNLVDCFDGQWSSEYDAYLSDLDASYASVAKMNGCE